MYFNVYLYNTISTDPGYISAMVGWSAAAATLTTLLMGALSDRVGKRKLFICGGYLLWGISTGGVRPRDSLKTRRSCSRRLCGGCRGGDDRRARLRHDVFRLDGQRRGVQRVDHRHRAERGAGQGRIRAGHSAAHFHARHFWPVRRHDTAAGNGRNSSRSSADSLF